jgi:colanic acid/amylovoran biosynthesis glycosyltransferase
MLRVPIRPPRGVAFLVSQHPAINHALLLREIRALRALHLDIHTVSIRDADRPSAELPSEERDEQSRTFYVKSQGIAGALRHHLPFLLQHPLRYLGGLFYALRLSAGNLPKALALGGYFAEAVIIGEWMRRQQLDHIHVQYSSTVGLLLCRMFPVQLSISFHGPDEFNDPAGFWLREKVVASHFVRAISFFARSQIMKSCEARYWDKIDIAYMGVDPTAFSPRPFRPDPKPFEMLCLGRLAPVKAQPILLDAVEQLKQQGRPVLLHLAGGGPDLDSLREAIAKRGLETHVTLHGWVVQDQLDALYRRADAFVLASFAEGLPGVLMEAMAMEIPCISTWIAGVPELIRDGVDGLLVAPSDAPALASAVARLMDDPALRLRIGKQSRQRILEKFDLHSNAEHLAGIFSRRLGIRNGDIHV